MAGSDQPGVFLVFEGLDGAGSTTQARLFVEALRSQRRAVVETAEPSTGPLGAVVRQVLQGRTRLSEEAVALAFAADRVDHLVQPERGILRHLAEGHWVVSDRYVISSFVYQTASGLDLDWIRTINRYATEPDLTVFIDVPVEECLARVTQRVAPSDRYEQEALLHHASRIYREQLAELADERVVVVPGASTALEVHNAVISSPHVSKLLAREI